jgi:hypothetical protein
VSKWYATLRQSGHTRISDIEMFAYLRQCSASGWMHSERHVMLTVMRRKTCTILAMLLVCTLVAAILECEVHVMSSADEHATTDGHTTPIGHRHSASPSMTGHLACLIAVLPTVMFLMWFACMWLSLSCGLMRLTPHVFLPYIPPKTALQ